MVVLEYGQLSAGYLRLQFGTLWLDARLRRVY